MQFDADTVGAPSMAADAEICMMAADTMEALGIKRGQYVVKVNNRKVLDGVMEAIGLGGDENADRRLSVLRALDKYDRLGWEGVDLLLGSGRKDESGDFTPGANLSTDQHLAIASAFVSGNVGERFRRFKESILKNENPAKILRQIFQDDSKAEFETREAIEQFFFVVGLSNSQSKSFRRPPQSDDLFYRLDLDAESFPFQVDNLRTTEILAQHHKSSALYQSGVAELREIARIVDSAGYGSGRILIDPSVVRGLEYYTGPVYEVELLLETKDEKGRPVRFGSVGGGGRYDGLVSRFMGQPVPATGFSIGVSRLQAALTLIGKLDSKPAPGPVLVTVFDRERVTDYQKMVATLRNAGIRSELYLGNPKHSVGQQLKYADRRHAPCAIIQGSDEKARGEVQIKDLVLGATLADSKERDEHLKRQAEAQVAVPEDKLVDEVRKVLARHGVTWG
jgi:histidyl-tRNA synthetase